MRGYVIDVLCCEVQISEEAGKISMGSPNYWGQPAEAPARLEKQTQSKFDLKILYIKVQYQKWKA
jgi:hypothetical protein